MRDRFLDRPPSLAGVCDPALDVREVRAFLLECALRELEEPRANDAALHPDTRDTLHVDVEVAGVDELEAFAVRLHHPVLDPVVDHLDEVARAALPEMRPTVRRCEGVERRLHTFDRARLAADHHAVAHVETPDASGDANVEVVEAERLVLLGAAHRVPEVRVAPVDQDVALGGESRELIEGVIGDVPGGDHRPQDARGLELLRHLLDRVGADRALGLRLVDRPWAAISRDDGMPPAYQPRDHVAAHPAQAVEPDLHAVTPLVRPRIFVPETVPAVPCDRGDRERGCDAPRSIPFAGSTAPRRQHPMFYGRGIRTPDLITLRGRSHRGLACGSPSLRLRPA